MADLAEKGRFRRLRSRRWWLVLPLLLLLLIPSLIWSASVWLVNVMSVALEIASDNMTWADNRLAQWITQPLIKWVSATQQDK